MNSVSKALVQKLRRCGELHPGLPAPLMSVLQAGLHLESLEAQLAAVEGAEES